MPPATGTALLILVAFVLPGFATVLIKERTHEAWHDTSQLERVLQTAYYSLWSYVLLAAFAALIGFGREDADQLLRDHEDTPADLVGRAAIAILAPSFIIANASRVWEDLGWRDKLYTRVGINARHRVPTAWDHFFAGRSRAMVLATLKDGRVVGGYYGRGGSFAAYAKDGRDLYLEQRWVLNDDNWFERPANDTTGVWLPTEEVVSIELYAVNDDDDESEAPQAAAEQRATGGQGRSQAPNGAGEAAEQAPRADP